MKLVVVLLLASFAVAQKPAPPQDPTPDFNLDCCVMYGGYCSCTAAPNPGCQFGHEYCVPNGVKTSHGNLGDLTDPIIMWARQGTKQKPVPNALTGK